MSIKRLVVALAGLFAVGWSGLALAQTLPTTACPTNFTCAFSAAESLSLVTPKSNVNTPGQPDVYLGYLVFDGSSGVTMTGVQNQNGVVSTIGGSANLPGTCAPAMTAGQPATITFPSGTKSLIVSFVRNSAGTELQFILTQDLNATSAQQSNSVRIGVCRQ